MIVVMKKCPFCAEEIQAAAIVCRYCGRELDTELPPDERKKCPYCAEWIRKEASVCRYCGRDLSIEEEVRQSPASVVRSQVGVELPIREEDENKTSPLGCLLSLVIGLFLALIISFQSFQELVIINQHIQEGALEELAFRNALQNFLFHFFINWFIACGVVYVLIRIWNRNKATSVFVIFLLFSGLIIFGGFLPEMSILTEDEETNSLNSQSSTSGAYPTRTTWDTCCEWGSTIWIETLPSSSSVCVSGRASNLEDDSFLLTFLFENQPDNPVKIILENESADVYSGAIVNVSGILNYDSNGDPIILVNNTGKARRCIPPSEPVEKPNWIE